MIVTTFVYTKDSNAKYAYKICVKDNDSNTVYQTNDVNKASSIMSKTLGDYNSCTIKYHYNYNKALTAIQTIYYKEDSNNV